ncbi:MAG: hypothetical protein KAI72_02515, partial [Candidatus Pacebacteria bacterium]|nr:hypothetical protein [Candidatus Paceibacterota bacterium]
EEGLILFISRNKRGELGALIKEKGESCRLTEGPKTIHWKQRRGIINGLSKLDKLAGISIDGVSAAKYIEKLLREKTDKDNEKNGDVRKAAKAGLFLRDNNEIEKSGILSSNQEEIIKDMMIKAEDTKELVLADGRKGLLFKVELDPGKWNFYYISPEGNGRWCFDEPVDSVTKWAISEKEFGAGGNKCQGCSVIIKSERTDIPGKKDEVLFEQISVGGAELVRIKENGKYQIYHVTAQGGRKDITGGVDGVRVWLISANGAGFVEVEEGSNSRVYHVTAQGGSKDITGLVDEVPDWAMDSNGAGYVEVVKSGKRKVYPVTAQGDSKSITFKNIKEAGLADGNKGLLFKVEQEPGKWNFYYISPEGNGRWCLDEPLNEVIDWDIGAKIVELGGEGYKYNICTVIIEGERKHSNGKTDEVSFKQISAGGAELVRIQENGKYQIYHVNAQGQKNDITGEVDSLPDWEISANGAVFVEVKEGEKHRVYHVTAQGQRKDITGLVDRVAEWKMGANGAGFVLVDEGDKWRLYHVTAQGESKDIVIESKQERILSDGRVVLLLKVEQEPGKWNFYYVTPEGYGRWCFDQPVDEVGNWHIYADEFGEGGNRYPICRITIKGGRTDTTGNKDDISFEQISAGGADLVKIKEGGKWQVFHVNAQGEK